MLDLLMQQWKTNPFHVSNNVCISILRNNIKDNLCYAINFDTNNLIQVTLILQIRIFNITFKMYESQLILIQTSNLHFSERVKMTYIFMKLVKPCTKWIASVGNRFNWLIYKNDGNRAIHLIIEQHTAPMCLNDSAIDSIDSFKRTSQNDSTID